jgi:hypothetical protein
MLGDDSDLYLQINESICKVVGPYHGGKLPKYHSYLLFNILFAFNMGIVDIYKFLLNEKTLKVVRINQIDLHFNLITSLFIKHDMFFTTSLDNSMKSSFIGVSPLLDKQLTYFKTIKYSISEHFQIDSSKIGTYSPNNGNIDLWNLKNGKVMASIDTQFDFIFSVAYSNGICLIIGSKSDNKLKNVSFKAYQKDKEPYQFSLLDCVSAKATYNKQRDTFVITSKTLNCTLQVYLVNNYINEFSVKLVESIGIETNENILDHISITCQNMLLFFHQKNEFIFMDIEKNETIAKKTIFTDSELPTVPGIGLLCCVKTACTHYISVQVEIY